MAQTMEQQDNELDMLAMILAVGMRVLVSTEMDYQPYNGPYCTHCRRPAPALLPQGESVRLHRATCQCESVTVTAHRQAHKMSKLWD